MSDDFGMGDGGFCKLYGDRLADSSLLECAVATRWIFLYMLARADFEGRFRCATVAGLARTAAVSLPQAERAVAELEAPDADSSTPDEDGRRIVRFPGGWQIVTYTKYRDYQTKRQRAEAERKRRQREAERARHEAARSAEGGTCPGTSRGHTHETPDVKHQTPPTTDTPLAPQRADGGDGGDRPELTLEPSTVKKRRGNGRLLAPTASAQAGASRFVKAFNAAFGRRVLVLPDLVRDFEARLGDGYAGEQLVTLPILAAAAELPDDLRRGMKPAWLLRNGSHPRAGADGRVSGGKNWVADLLSGADRTTLWPQHVQAAQAVGVLDELRRLGVRFAEFDQ